MGCKLVKNHSCVCLNIWCFLVLVSFEKITADALHWKYILGGGLCMGSLKLNSLIFTFISRKRCKIVDFYGWQCRLCVCLCCCLVAALAELTLWDHPERGGSRAGEAGAEGGVWLDDNAHGTFPYSWSFSCHLLSHTVSNSGLCFTA